MRRVTIFAIVLAFTTGACWWGKKFKPLNPKDMSLSAETRQWVADAEDGVIAAKARRDWARVNLEDMKEWRDRMHSQTRWSKGGGALRKAAGGFMASRVKLAKLQLSHAEAALSFAKAKYKLINAERSVLHDLARYDLKPLQRRAQKYAAKMRKTRDAVWEQRQAVQRATSKFWKAYGSYSSGGGNTISFWIGRQKPINMAAEAKKARKKAAEKKKKKEAKEKEKKEEEGPTPDWAK
jgi:hypothetical protein